MREEIENGIAAWGHGADSDDIDLMTSSLAPDATYTIHRIDDSVTGPMIGLAAVKEYIKHNVTPHPPGRNLRHLLTNILVTPMSETQVTVTYYGTQIAVVEGRPIITGHGHYEDVWAIDDSDVWLCKTRVLYQESRGADLRQTDNVSP